MSLSLQTDVRSFVIFLLYYTILWWQFSKERFPVLLPIRIKRLSGESISTGGDVNLWRSIRKVCSLKKVLIWQVLRLKFATKLLILHIRQLSVCSLSLELGEECGKYVCALKFSGRHDSTKSSETESLSSVSSCHGSEIRTLMDRVDLRNPRVLEKPGLAFSQWRSF
jgi:hypothetical protein